MAKLLYLEASPRHEHSFSSRVAAAFLETYRDTNPDDSIDHLHLFDDPLPEFDGEAATQKMQHIQRLIKEGKGIEPVGKWAAVVEQIDRLKAADKVLLSSPMWNYSIPYRLKQYIDVVMQPALTFYVNRQGEYKGLLKDRPVQMILASGSAYETGFPRPDDGTKTDFQRAYLEHIAQVLGFTDIRVIKIQPTEDAAPAAIEDVLADNITQAKAAGRQF